MENKNQTFWTKNKVILIFLVVFSITNFFINWQYSKKQAKSKEYRTPQTDFPNLSHKSETSTAIGGLTDLKSTDLITESYKTKNIFINDSTYNNNAFKVGLWGDFSVVELHIKGDVKNDLHNFLLLNFNNFSGTFQSERISPNQLNPHSSLAFKKNENNEIDVFIDLMTKNKFATTKKEFVKTQNSYKRAKLWNYLYSTPKSGTVANVYATTYNEKGQYDGGVSIKKLEFKYSCKTKEDNCKIFNCTKFKTNSACIKENISSKAANTYIRN